MDNLDHKSKGAIEGSQQNSSNPSSRNSQRGAQKSKTLDQKGSARQNNVTLLKRTHSWYDFMVSPFTSAAATSSSDNKWSQDHKLGVAEACCQTNPTPPQTSVEPGLVPNAKIISSNAPPPSLKAEGLVKNKHKNRRCSDKVLAHKACQTPAEWAKDLDLDLFAIATNKNDYRKTNGVRSHLNSRESYRISTLKLRVMDKYQHHSKSRAGGNLGIEPNSYLARSMAQTFKSLNQTQVEREVSMGSERVGQEVSSSTLLNRSYFDYQDTTGHDDNGYCDFKLNNNNIDSSNATTNANEDTHSNTSPPSPHSAQGSVSMASSPSPQQAMSYPLSTSPLDSEAIIAEIEKFCLKHGVTDSDAKGDALHYDTKKCDGRIPPLPFQNNIAAKYLNDTTAYNIGEDKQNQALKSPVTTTATLTDEQKRFWPKMQGDNHYSDEEQASWDDMKKFYKERIVHIPLALNVKKPSEMMYTIPDFPDNNKKDFKGYYDRTSPDGASSPPTLGTQVKVTGYNDSKSAREREGKGKDEYKISDHFEQDGHFEGKGSNRFHYLPVPTKVNFVLKPSVYSAFSAVNNYGRLNDVNHDNNIKTKAEDILY